MTTMTEVRPENGSSSLTPAAAIRGKSAPRGRLSRTLRGPDGDPPWARPALVGLLTLTALLYVWGLGASGNANSFYAAAVQAGTKSWKAMFFGSFDAGNAITVDKPPFSLWPMVASGRIFGFSSWSMLAPQAVEGVLAVALLAAAVRRVSGHCAGLVAGAALALTPVAVLMFRFNNPDAMLTLLLTAAGYCTVRAIQAASLRWLALTGVVVGLGFLTKMGQTLLVVPALALAYLIAAPTSLRKRVAHLLLSGVAVVAGAGWYIAIVELWPASSRPYIGGSTTNSLLGLALGYNGLGRILGGSGNGGGVGGGQSGSFGGATGLGRLFTSDMATEVSWLLPAALVSLVVGLWLTRRAPHTDLRRASLALWGGWLLASGLTFSYMQGTIHPYYAVALSPAIAALVAIGGQLVWDARAHLVARLSLAVMVVGTVAWSVHLLEQTPTWFPALRCVLIAAGALAAVGVLLGNRLPRIAGVVVLSVLVAGLGGSAAYAVETASVPHSGSIPSSGPVASGIGGDGGGMGQTRAGSGTPPTGQRPSGGQAPPSSTGATTSSTSSAAGARSPGGGETANAQLVALLKATSQRWAAATVGSQTAGPLELASGKAVISIGGFNGGDAAPTLAQFQSWVSAGLVHYFIGTSASGNGGGPDGSDGTGSQISSWVAAHFTATTVGGQTVYDLTST